MKLLPFGCVQLIFSHSQLVAGMQGIARMARSRGTARKAGTAGLLCLDVQPPNVSTNWGCLTRKVVPYLLGVLYIDARMRWAFRRLPSCTWPAPGSFFQLFAPVSINRHLDEEGCFPVGSPINRPPPPKKNWYPQRSARPHVCRGLIGSELSKEEVACDRPFNPFC